MVEDEAATARSVREHRDAAHPKTLKTNDLKLAAIRNPRHSWGTGATAVSEPAWKVANRAHWDELVAVHLGPRGYNLTNLRERRGRLNAIERRSSGRSTANIYAEYYSLLFNPFVEVTPFSLD
jgi:hypothetical protein